MQHQPANSAALPVFDALNEAVSAANRLPLGDDVALIRTLSETVDHLSAALNADIQHALRDVARVYVPSHLTPPDDVFAVSRELVDRSIEQFNLAMDDHNGFQSRAQPTTFQPQSRGNPFARNASTTAALPIHRFDMRKPQLDFPDYPIDNSKQPFVPPFATAPNRPADQEEHPFEADISKFLAATSAFPATHPTRFNALQRTPFSFISTEEQLAGVVDRLKNEREVAIDLENHSERSYQGFLCLMQVSTRSEDFVIDTLKLRGCIHRHMALLFRDPTILKVLHGADHDVEWLERDFGIYIVGLFDTGQAARCLGYKSASLSFLLQKFCDINAGNKRKYQMADWRIRPIPNDMMAYARSDTHYLLYIYDMVKQALRHASKLNACWHQSADVCRKRYRKPAYNPKLPFQVSAKQRLRLRPFELKLLGELFEWRDEVARREDESPHYVAPVKTLVHITQNGSQCRNKESLAHIARGAGYIPPFVERDACPLACIIRNSLATSFGGLVRN